MPDMRTNRFHVDISVRLLHGRILHDWTKHGSNLHVHRHGYLLVRIHGMHQWHFLGPTE
jgi:hypothetical protein